MSDVRRYVVGVEKEDWRSLWGVHAYTAEDAIAQAKLVAARGLLKVQMCSPYTPKRIEPMNSRQSAGVSCFCSAIPGMHTHLEGDTEWDAMNARYKEATLDPGGIR